MFSVSDFYVVDTREEKSEHCPTLRVRCVNKQEKIFTVYKNDFITCSMLLTACSSVFPSNPLETLDIRLGFLHWSSSINGTTTSLSNTAETPFHLYITFGGERLSHDWNQQCCALPDDNMDDSVHTHNTCPCFLKKLIHVLKFLLWCQVRLPRSPPGKPL